MEFSLGLTLTLTLSGHFRFGKNKSITSNYRAKSPSDTDPTPSMVSSPETSSAMNKAIVKSKISSLLIRGRSEGARVMSVNNTTPRERTLSRSRRRPCEVIRFY